MTKDFLHFKNSKPFRMFDIIVVVFVLALVIATLVVAFLPKGNFVNVYVENELVYSLDINKNQVQNVNNLLQITIQDGKVFVSSSNCKNQLCHQHAPINVGQIICLPQNVIIKIEGNSKLDVITGLIYDN